MRAKSAATATRSAAKTKSEGVRITVEQDKASDGEGHTDDEEVEDIGSEEDSSDDAASAAKQQEQKKGKRKSAEAGGAAGLANVIRGLLLAKPTAAGSGACPILARALTDRQRFAPANGGADQSGEGDESNVDIGKQRRKLTIEHRRWLCAGRSKPKSLSDERETERQLERVACRGVVQLFNAVRAQQKSLEARLAGRSEAGRQRVLASLSRNDFLDMLAGRRKAADDKSGDVEGDDDDEALEGEQQKKKQRKPKKSWGVLSEDYLVKPTLTMKDWDRASSGSSADEAGGVGQEPMEQDDEAE